MKCSAPQVQGSIMTDDFPKLFQRQFWVHDSHLLSGFLFNDDQHNSTNSPTFTKHNIHEW